MEIEIERRAQIAIRSLRGIDLKRVMQAVKEISSKKKIEISKSPKSHKIVIPNQDPSTGKSYLYECGRDLRLILSISKESDSCKLVDIVNHDKIKRLIVQAHQ